MIILIWVAHAIVKTGKFGSPSKSPDEWGSESTYFSLHHSELRLSGIFDRAENSNVHVRPVWRVTGAPDYWRPTRNEHQFAQDACCLIILMPSAFLFQDVIVVLTDPKLWHSPGDYFWSCSVSVWSRFCWLSALVVSSVRTSVTGNGMESSGLMVSLFSVVETQYTAGVVFYEAWQSWCHGSMEWYWDGFVLPSCDG